MGATQSDAAAGGQGGGRAAAQEATMKADPEVERQRVISLLGLDVSEGKDQVTWLDKSLGFQSKCFLVRGERWKGRGKQPVVDPTAAERGSAFVKALPTWSAEEMVEHKRCEAKQKAEAEARASGATKDEVASRGKEASEKVAVVEWAEQSQQLAREREVLRAWQAAEESGELKLPEDTMLVIPRLLDNVVVDPFRQEEEAQPKFLVFEDLAAAGFKTQHYTETLSVDDAVAVSGALADFHAALWRIRHRIEQSTADSAQGPVASQKGLYETLLRESVKEIRDFELDGLADIVEPFLSEIVDGFADDKVGPFMLGHGDPWAHNIMLRRAETGEVSGVAFVDLGNIRRMNPLVDFYSFLGTTMDMDTLYSPGISLPVCKNYRTRLVDQLPDIAKTLKDDDGKDILLFSTRARLHAFAGMLPFFFAMPNWLFGGKPAISRFVRAFRYTAQLAERHRMGCP